ncbi:shikimate dehydrogenase [Pseudogracilibacillus sp. ICA-222130]|uniref:shikimate dehydrogenase n=1 Tax=Pseudogracilibacillus sp. ICA-222130 TaxID=3134655 RepID=UPI0030C3FA36
MYKFGLIGYPIQHSLSPWIHRQFFERTNIEGTYDIYEIDVHAPFDEKIATFKELQLDGFNVTAPYKETIIPYLDELDEQASMIGAVNTVLNKNGKWYGFNTDGAGYVRSLLSKYPVLANEKNKAILLLGAGGACKGIYNALIKEGFTNITIANRTLEKAVSIIGQRNGKVMTIEEASQCIHTFPLVIQTTSVGMKPYTDRTILELNEVHEKAIVSDIVYQPLETAFLQRAKQLGASIHFGHTMLLYQAQYAFEIWTNTTPKMEQLDAQLEKKLEG